MKKTDRRGTGTCSDWKNHRGSGAWSPPLSVGMFGAGGTCADRRTGPLPPHPHSWTTWRHDYIIKHPFQEIAITNIELGQIWLNWNWGRIDLLQKILNYLLYLKNCFSVCTINRTKHPIKKFMSLLTWITGTRISTVYLSTLSNHHECKNWNVFVSHTTKCFHRKTVWPAAPAKERVALEIRNTK